MFNNIYTFEDLYKDISSKHKTNLHFSEQDAVKVDMLGNLTFSDVVNDDSGLLPVRLKACHDGENFNHSKIDLSVLENRLSSFDYRPILGYIHELDDGTFEFGGHEMHLADGDVVYDERPVGVIKKSDNNHIEKDDDMGKSYVVVDGYIYENYSKAAEILKEKEECPVSVELAVIDMSYDADEELLTIKDFVFTGVTILGCDGDGNPINPAMVGSKIELAKPDNGVVINKFSEEGGNNAMELENKDIEVESKDSEIETKDAETETKDFEEETKSEDETNVEVKDADDESTASEEVYQKVFELSHDDIRAKIYRALDVVEAADRQCYCLDAVYDDYFVYGCCYAQKYHIENDEVVFDGERYEVKPMFLTPEECIAVEEMRANYPAIKDELSKYKDEPQKLEILNSSDYNLVENDPEFVELKNVDNHFDMTIDDVRSAADSILLEASKHQTFSKNVNGEDVNIGKMKFPTKSYKTKIYGDILDDEIK